MFHSTVAGQREARVVDVAKKNARRPRPPGLNTVELLKTASKALGIGPGQAMVVCGSARGC